MLKVLALITIWAQAHNTWGTYLGYFESLLKFAFELNVRVVQFIFPFTVTKF